MSAPDPVAAALAEVDRCEASHGQGPFGTCAICDRGLGECLATYEEPAILAAEVRALRKRIVTLEERCALIDADGDHAWDEYHAVRQRHAAAVEAAFREGYREGFREMDCSPTEAGDTAAWLASDAKRGLT